MSPRGAEFNASLRAAASQKILACARILFEKHGFDSVTTADIAARAGVSKALVFKYFPTKFDLLAALVREHAISMVEAVKAARHHGNARLRLRDAIHRLVQRCLELQAAHRLYLSLLLRQSTRTALAASPFDPRPTAQVFNELMMELLHDAGSSNARRDLFFVLAAIDGTLVTAAIHPKTRVPSARVVTDRVLRTIALSPDR